MTTPRRWHGRADTGRSTGRTAQVRAPELAGPPRQLPPLRAEVRCWLTPFTLPDDAEDDLVLAVSEAASNSVEHAYAPPTADDTVELTFWTAARAIYIVIVDHSHWQTSSDQPTGRGRGIEIMQRLIAFVLIHHDNRGTRVLLRHPLPDVLPRHAAPSGRAHAVSHASGRGSGASWEGRVAGSPRPDAETASARTSSCTARRRWRSGRPTHRRWRGATPR